MVMGCFQSRQSSMPMPNNTAQSPRSSTSPVTAPPPVVTEPLPTPVAEHTAHILGLMEKDFLADASRSRQIEADLATSLERARNFGSEYGSPEDWNRIWRLRWDYVEGILRRIHKHVAEMDDAIAGNEMDRLGKALVSWEALQVEDSILVDVLSDLRTQAIDLNPGSHLDWNALALTLEANVETIHSGAQAVRAKLERLKDHSKGEVDALVSHLIAQLPIRTTAEEAAAAAHADAYDRAVVELHQEQYQSLGLMDTIKTMFFWMESPEERMRKNRSLSIQQP